MRASGQQQLERRKRPTCLLAVEQDTCECAQEPKGLNLADDPGCDVGALVHLQVPCPRDTVVDLDLGNGGDPDLPSPFLARFGLAILRPSRLFRHQFWVRLLVNVAIVLGFAAFYLRFLKRA